jgi:hypothetical protein
MDKIKIFDELSQHTQAKVDEWLELNPDISITAISSTGFVDRHASTRLIITIVYIILNRKKKEADLLAS